MKGERRNDLAADMARFAHARHDDAARAAMALAVLAPYARQRLDRAGKRAIQRGGHLFWTIDFELQRPPRGSEVIVRLGCLR